MTKIKLNNWEKSHENMTDITKTKKSVAFFEANVWHGNLCRKFIHAPWVGLGNGGKINKK